VTHFLIEQAIFELRIVDCGLRIDEQAADNPQFGTWARSDGFRDEWLALAEEIMIGFGERPFGIACPLAVFAQPFGREHVAVVQVTDRPHAAGRVLEPSGSSTPEGQPVTSDPNLLAFHFLILPRQSYERFVGDPFHLAQQLPAAWQQRGTLPAHSWPCQPLPERTVEEVQRVLKRTKVRWGEEPKDEQITTKDNAKPLTELMAHSVENAESPALLGGAQVLVDGGRLVFRRPAPDLALVQGLWTLLPASTRCRLWPTSFAFTNNLDFDVVVLPRVQSELFEHYTTEEQAMDYPEGRFELNLQIAAEHGDQKELTALLNRASVAETKRLGAILLGFMIALVLVFGVLDRIFKPPTQPGHVQMQAAAVASTVASMAADVNPWSRLATLQQGRHIFNKHAGDAE